MGEHNSSITRVRPVFRSLLARDAGGTSWLSTVLRLAGRGPARALADRPGRLLPELLQRRQFTDKVLGKIELENCFERPIAPPPDFLCWLIKHPERMRQPTASDVEKWGKAARRQRTKIFGQIHEQQAAQADALRALAGSGAEKSRRKWWAFEGFTEVDCFLETEKLVLLVEGKRTERLSSSTKWFPSRSQLWRNLEVASLMAGSKEYGVVLISERAAEIPPAAVSYPHLGAQDQKVLEEHYLGSITWRDLCEATGLSYEELPETVAEARRQ